MAVVHAGQRPWRGVSHPESNSRYVMRRRECLPPPSLPRQSCYEVVQDVVRLVLLARVAKDRLLGEHDPAVRQLVSPLRSRGSWLTLPFGPDADSASMSGDLSWNISWTIRERHALRHAATPGPIPATKPARNHWRRPPGEWRSRAVAQGEGRFDLVTCHDSRIGSPEPDLAWRALLRPGFRRANRGVSS